MSTETTAWTVLHQTDTEVIRWRPSQYHDGKIQLQRLTTGGPEVTLYLPEKAVRELVAGLGKNVLGKK